VDFNVTYQLLIRYSTFVILERKWEYNGRAHQLFIEFEKAYDSGEKYYTIFSSNFVYL
jgi:hypothetical protein